MRQMRRSFFLFVQMVARICKVDLFCIRPQYLFCDHYFHSKQPVPKEFDKAWGPGLAEPKKFPKDLKRKMGMRKWEYENIRKMCNGTPPKNDIFGFCS